MKRICEFNRRMQKYRETLYEAFTKDGRHRQMKRQVAYKQGYKIVICGKFYEVSDTKRILYYGNLSHIPTVQEVWNKTIGIQLAEENYKGHRNNAYSRLRGKAIGA